MEISDKTMTRRAAHKQRIIDEFWSKWIQSYHLDYSNDEEIVDNVEENVENKESHTRSVDNVEEVEEMNSYEPNDDNLEETEGDQVNVNREPSDPLEDRIIAPSSTGRKRWAPSKLFL